MSKRILVLICSIFLIVPLVFMGCSGDTGPAGAAGRNGTNGTDGVDGTDGTPGSPGAGGVADDTCVLCHGVNKDYEVARMHNIDKATGKPVSAGTVTVNVTSVTFGTPGADNNVPTAINFTFAATDENGSPVDLNLTAASGNLPHTRFSLAKLVPGQTYATSAKDPNQWYDYVNGRREASGLVKNADGSYTFTFAAGSVKTTAGEAQYDATLAHRAAIQVSSLPLASFSSNPTLTAPFENVTFDFVPNGSAITVTKNNVTTAACQACHAPGSGIAHGTRYRPEFCVLCHNPSLINDGNLVKLVHKTHMAQQDNLVVGNRQFPVSEITYPQTNIGNCTTCHKGTDPYWNTRPSIEACGSCHPTVDFTTGANHGLGGVQVDNSICFVCHSVAGIKNVHSNKDGGPPTPNNPTVPGTVATIGYFIDNVVIGAGGFPIVTFHVTKDGAPLALASPIAPPTGFTGSPSFLLAYASPQGTNKTPSDYNNLGRASGQPASVNLTGLTITGTSAAYTTTLTTAFPAGATMRSIGFQGYWTQTAATTGNDAFGRPLGDVPRHTPGFVFSGAWDNSTGTWKRDAIRRTVVKSEYDSTTGQPVGCLECHEVFEGHGGNRVNNVQLCVMCHNPSLTTSGRTYPGPYLGTLPEGVSSDPLTWPETTNNMKDMIHGIHSADMRVTPFLDYRYRSGNMYFYDFSEITYPGNLEQCMKCHLGDSYKADLPVNLLNATTRVTTGNPAEDTAAILAARASVPNSTDLVNTPSVSACGYCHNTPVAISHYLVMGGKVQGVRSEADAPLPTLAPAMP
ncbi:MAG: OmcA/MtrC family decaheme c-type cytochrome [Deltaproteobacteria bacterium]|nr:MAG: OmcA/MtrC family decaheme c-type cytochrome [Deltaproteobacteria bacterium]